MKQPMKRTLSLILSLAMLFSMTGLSTVFAAEGAADVADSDSGVTFDITGTAGRSVPVNVANALDLQTALEETTAATINVTEDIAMGASITVRASHTLNIAAGKTVSTVNYTLIISDDQTLTLSGPGTLKANNSDDNSTGITVGDRSTLALQDGSKLVAANSGRSSSGVLLRYEAKLTGVRAAITTENTGENSKGIGELMSSTVSLTGGTLTVTKGIGNSYGVLVHTLTTSGAAISIANTGYYGISSTQASITGGTVSVTNSGASGINAEALTLKNTAVTVKNTNRSGIDVPQHGSLSLVGSTIALQNTELQNPVLDGGMYLNSGATLTMDATSAITIASSGGSTGLNGLFWATRNITAGAKITLEEGAGLSTVQDCFVDQGILCTTNIFTVGAASATPDMNGLSAGDYVWNGTHFAKAAAAADVLINAQSFPDASFRNWLLKQPYGKDGKLTAAEIVGIAEIDVSYQNITSLTGIQHFTALTKLDCSQNRLKEMDVTGLPLAGGLNCTYNYMPSEAAVKGFNGKWGDGFRFSPQHAVGFVAVLGIDGVPTAAKVGVPLALTGTVFPADATNKAIVWSVEAGAIPDETGSVFTGNVLTAKKPGTVIVKATIANGTANGIAFVQFFAINVTAGGGSTGGSGGSVSSWKPEATVEVASPSVDATGAVKPADVAKAAAEKVAAALKAGKKNPQANVVVQNATSVSAATLNELAAAAKKAGGTARLLADTTENGKVVGRMYVDTALAANLKNDVLLRVTTNTADTAATAALFQKHFGARVAVVSLAQQGPIGMRVQIAVKADPAIDTKKPLYFYVFDKKTNRYYPVANPAYTIDKNGWLYFFTDRGGEILYTNTPLSNR